jgi:myo-inositol-1(or 4)-monophosphatase
LPGSDLDLLTNAAREAGEIALRYWKRSPEFWEKEDGTGPVTVADLAVNDMLVSELRRARPDYGWLSEETPDSSERMTARRCFIIDPIDGTRAFMDGTPDFAHSLAIAEDGKVTAAVVYLPAQNRLYSASTAASATQNGVPLKVTAAASVDGASVLTARPNLAPEHWRGGVPPPVRRVFRSSLAWRLALVAEGAFDGMLTLRPTWEWDVAAGALIVERAGGRVSDRAGRSLRFNSRDPRVGGCVAAAPAVHEGLLAALK